MKTLDPADKSRRSEDQVRVTCWLDRDLLAQFNKMHPAHGALTHFIRASFERYVKRMKADVNKLLAEETPVDPS